MTTLVCHTCNKSFERPQYRLNEAARRGQKKYYCSQHCLYTRCNSKPRIVSLTCHHCGKQFERSAAAQRYRSKHGDRATHKTYCSRKCYSSSMNDGLSQFRKIRNSARNSSRTRGREFNLTLEHLRDLWHKQGGKCALTGWELRLPKNTYVYVPRNEDKWHKRGPRNASLDRIDNTGGYTIGNVRWVAWIANEMRKDRGDELFLEVCHAVVEHAKQQ